MRQAYDFFSNPKVTRKNLLEPHFDKTIERVKSSQAEYILAIQDGTYLNYTSHKAKKESLGRIGKSGNTDQYGLIQHSNLLVTNQNEPLGLIDISHFHNDENDVSIPRNHRNIEDKKNKCWLESVKKMRNRIGKTNKKIITVADREGDFFEFLQKLDEQQESFVVRAKNNRFTGEKQRDRENKLFDLLSSTTPIGKFEIDIYNSKDHKIESIELAVKRVERIQIPKPHRSKENSSKNKESLFLNVVMAYNAEYSWTLLTDLPVENIEKCYEIISIYRSRWHIEEYHKILKTAYQIDELYLHSSREAIENALTMISISACRFYWMLYVGRVEQTIRADAVLSEFEWKSSYVYLKEKIPKETPSLKEAIINIARMGGYKVTKKGSPPGVKSIWLGFQAVGVASQIYENMVALKT
jgi:hypothetical protein